jgi:hypothetical protein
MSDRVEPCDEGGEAPCMAHLFEPPDEDDDDVPEAMGPEPTSPRR